MDYSKCSLGLELGSTRIKAVLINEQHLPIASGSFEWENHLENGIWTYPLEEVRLGLRGCFADLQKNAIAQFGQPIDRPAAIGISGMMHGYLPFDESWQPLCAFRTWRNTITGQAAKELTELFSFNIPQRWSIAHLYQAMLNGEEHLAKIAHLTTLAGYVHYCLTGENVLGIGEASGMFPIDSSKLDYNAEMLDKFQLLTRKMGYAFDIRSILPIVLPAGQCGGHLTKAGAALLDESGALQPGIFLCPPEGDAGTGMAATNSVRVHTGNVSAGTSDFAMVVVDKLPGLHREIDLVTTPDGLPTAMVHCNNCTSDINAWVGLFAEFARLIGKPMEKGELFSLLLGCALGGKKDGGGLLSFNYLSGEGVTDLDEGRPIFTRMPDAPLNIPDFFRVHLMSALATLKIGLDILVNEEHVRIDRLYGHGGFFKTPVIGQTLLSAAAQAPVSVMQTAGEGGPYGMALLAAYAVCKEDGETLADYLSNRVFANAASSTLLADEADIEGFNRFIRLYKKALDLEKTAISVMTED